MPLADLTAFADSLLGQSVYFGPLLLLLLCGMGLPLPEEISLIGAGVLLHEGSARFDLMLAVCVLGVVGGDAIPYTVGRLWGTNALRYRAVRRSLHPRRFRKIERRFQAHRNWAIFTCRFFPGLRWPGYFVAGTMRMSVPRWLALDVAGALIQVPLALWLGLQFGANVERLRSELDQLHLVLGLGLVLAIAGGFLLRRMRRRRVDVPASTRPRPLPAPPAEPQLVREVAPRGRIEDRSRDEDLGKRPEDVRRATSTRA